MNRAMRRGSVVALVGAFLLVSVAWAQISTIDLALDKSWEDFFGEPLSSVVAGGPALIHLSVANSGEVADAYNVVVQDFLPVGVIPYNVQLDQGSFIMGVPGDPARPFTWNVGYVAANDEGGPIDLYLAVEVDPSVADDTILWNDAVTYSADPSEYDYDNSDNVASAALNVYTEADLEISMSGPFVTDGLGAPGGINKQVFEGDIVSGTVVTYAIDVTNNGPSVARAVKMWSWVEHGFSIQSARIIGGDGSVAVLNQEDAGSDVECDLGDIAPAPAIPVNAPPNGEAPEAVAAAAGTDTGSRTILVDVLALPEAYWYTFEGEFGADVVSGEWDAPPLTYDPDTSDNYAYLYPYVIGMVDVSITKTANVSTVLPGGQVVYTLTVTNAGPSDAIEISVFDELPSGTVLTGVSTNQTEYLEYDDGGLWWGLYVLRAGESATLQIQATVASDPSLVGQTLYNEAWVELANEEIPPAPPAGAKGFAPERQPIAGYYFDPNELNNEAIAAVLVGSANLPDLVCEWWDTGLINDGKVLVGTLHVTNQGTAIARRFQVHIGLSDDGDELNGVDKSAIIRNLSPGSSTNVPFRRKLGRSGMDGRLLMGIADALDTIEESFEDNNIDWWEAD